MNDRFKTRMNKQQFPVDKEKSEYWFKQMSDALFTSGYLRDQHNLNVKEIIHEMATAMRWISRNPDKGVNYIPPKTVFIFGASGTGKTLFFDIISDRFNCIRTIDVDKIEEEIIKPFGFREWQWFAQFDDCHLVIDDIGTETDKQVINTIVARREKLWKNNGILTFYTSNLKNRDELEAKYGTRIKSRLLGQCNFIKLTGKDRRES